MKPEALKPNKYNAPKHTIKTYNDRLNKTLELNKYKTQGSEQTRDDKLNKTLKGVLINSHVVNQNTENAVSFDEIKDSLFIMSNNEEPVYDIQSQMTHDQSVFDAKKAIKPLLIGTGIILAGSFGLSAILKASSKTLLNSKSFECLPDLAINNNIKQEPQFAIYRAIRDPNLPNIFAALAVFIFTGITIASKNFVDGLKEIWLKKKSADIEKNLQENLIKVETASFSGKLKVVNNLMSKNLEYFESKLNNKKMIDESNLFSDFISFKGCHRKFCDKTNEVRSEQNFGVVTLKGEQHVGFRGARRAGCDTRLDDKKENNDEQKNTKEINNNIKYVLLSLGIITGAFLLGKFSLSNLKKTAENTNKLANNITENTINNIKEKAKNPNEKDLSSIINWFKEICAKPEFIEEIGAKYGLTEEKIKAIINDVEQEKKTIFADAPTALGGIPKKLQYYCYIDENRGHLYNWLLHRENRFTKYIFLSFTISSAIGYMFKQAMDAIKDATVMSENAKTELNLKQRLVDVEIRNFKAKKESAINPLIENFTQQSNSGTKSKEELKQLADNILTEIKNGPPYVYT